jgi:hypothetical protein
MRSGSSSSSRCKSSTSDHVRVHVGYGFGQKRTAVATLKNPRAALQKLTTRQVNDKQKAVEERQKAEEARKWLSRH